MAKTRKVLREEMKALYLDKVIEHFMGVGEEVLRTGSNEIAFPIVDNEGNEDFIQIVVKIPTGSRDGEPYNGYDQAKDYAFKCEQKAIKAAKQAEAKAKKIAKDEAHRKAQAEARAKAQVQEVAVE